MTKRQTSNWGKALFIMGFFVVCFGAIGGGLYLSNVFIIPGIGLALILASFLLLSCGSRIGDKQN